MPDGQIGMPGEKGVLVVVAGRQQVGKTTVANALVQYYSALGCRFEVWNADQQNRSHSLSSFFADALTPPPGGLVDGRMWLEQRLRDQVRRRSNAVLDPGGGWTSFASLVREIPLVTALDAEGIRVVALFCAGAERADLDYLEHYAEADLFMPASTMIVLNAGLVLSGQSAKRIKSLCGAKPSQKLGWTNAGVGEGVGLWRFHPGRSVPRPRITGRAARPRERGQRITVRNATFFTVAGIIWPRFGAMVGVATAGSRGVPGHAATRPSSGRGGRCRSWSHGLMARERTG